MSNNEASVNKCCLRITDFKLQCLTNKDVVSGERCDEVRCAYIYP